MYTQKLHSGGNLPAIRLPLVGGGEIDLHTPAPDGRWKLVFIYRGLHCPLCHGYLRRLEELKDGFAKVGADIVVASGDPVERAQAMVDEEKLTFPVAYDLSIPQMEMLGLWISDPRSPTETDRPFAEPGLFALNETGALHLIDQSNTPFNRADLAELLDTVEWIRANHYPIRGTHLPSS